MFTYKMLPLNEWERLEDIYYRNFPNIPMPTPELASVAVAEDETGSIKGFWFIQLCAHMEPAAVEDTGVSLHEMRSVLHENLSNPNGLDYYVYTATKEWETALTAAGFKQLGIAYMGHIPAWNEEV